MSSDPRDTARNWLAGRYREARRLCLGKVPCAGCVADAILSAPGVEVDPEIGTYDERSDWLLADFRYGVPDTHRRVVIRLPAQPIGSSGDALTSTDSAQPITEETDG